MPTPKLYDDFGTGTFEDELAAGMFGGGPGDEEPMPEELDDNGLEECPECGAPMGVPCDPQCPNADEPEGVDPDSAYDRRFENHDHAATQVDPGAGNHPEGCECKGCNAEKVNESSDFDRFMNRILSEENKKGLPVLNDSPHRKRALREQERPMGRTRFGGK